MLSVVVENIGKTVDCLKRYTTRPLIVFPWIDDEIPNKDNSNTPLELNWAQKVDCLGWPPDPLSASIFGPLGSLVKTLKTL